MCVCACVCVCVYLCLTQIREHRAFILECVWSREVSATFTHISVHRERAGWG